MTHLVDNDDSHIVARLRCNSMVDFHRKAAQIQRLGIWWNSPNDSPIEFDSDDSRVCEHPGWFVIYEDGEFDYLKGIRKHKFLMDARKVTIGEIALWHSWSMLPGEAVKRIACV